MSNDVMAPNEEMYPSGPVTSNDAVFYKAKGKSFGIRAGAYIIDTIVIYLISYGVGFVTGFFVGLVLYIAGREFPGEVISAQCLQYAITLLVFLMYFTLFEGIYGATPGKLITGMRVVKVDGEPCDIRSAFHRGLWRFIDGFIFGAVAYSNMKPPLQQRLGDKKAHTLVVGRNEPLIQHQRAWYWFLIALVIYLAFDMVTIALSLTYAISNS